MNSVLEKSKSIIGSNYSIHNNSSSKIQPFSPTSQLNRSLDNHNHTTNQKEFPIMYSQKGKKIGSMPNNTFLILNCAAPDGKSPHTFKSRNKNRSISFERLDNPEERDCMAASPQKTEKRSTLRKNSF